MTRGELWTVSGGVYATKPRPALVLQAEHFADLDSITVAPLTTTEIASPFFRIAIRPTEANGLCTPCHVMVDKITTVPRRSLGVRMGLLEDDLLLQVNRATALFLGIV